jgi:hypothetical protein
MGVSGQRRPRFTPGERTPVPIVQEARWAPEPVWTQRLEEKSVHMWKTLYTVKPGVKNSEVSHKQVICKRTQRSLKITQIRKVIQSTHSSSTFLKVRFNVILPSTPYFCLVGGPVLTLRSPRRNPSRTTTPCRRSLTVYSVYWPLYASGSFTHNYRTRHAVVITDQTSGQYSQDTAVSCHILPIHWPRSRCSIIRASGHTRAQRGFGLLKAFGPHAMNCDHKQNEQNKMMMEVCCRRFNKMFITADARNFTTHSHGHSFACDATDGSSSMNGSTLYR